MLFHIYERLDAVQRAPKASGEEAGGGVMRNVGLLPIVLCLTTLGWGELRGQEAPSTGNLTVIVVGMESDQGTIKMALSNSAEDYTGQEDHEPFRGVSVAIQEKEATHIFPALPYGHYALKLYHDMNGNDRLDTNFLGIPTEPHAFSNNARAQFGPPSYEEAKFSVDSPRKTLRIDFR